MDREEAKQDVPSHPTYGNTKEESSRKPLCGVATGVVAGGGGGDRLKRDEWSEGAVSSLLDAYESKWILRNRAKLKGHDWEDVARHVSSRANSTKSPKTQTQCKNKIESMKKRYRSESATAESSTWPLFQRLDHLLRCRTHPPPATSSHPPLVVLDHSSPPPPSPPCPLAPQPPQGIQQVSHDSNGPERHAKQEDGLGTKQFDHNSDKNPMDTDSITPSSNGGREDFMPVKKKMKMEEKKKKKRQRREDWEVAESVRWLAEVVVRSEQARMETMKELERIRMEAEAKKGEIDLKRTEIIANTQLEIARLLAGNGRGVESSSRIGRS